MLEMTCLCLFIIVFEATDFVHMKLLAEQAFSHKFAFDKKHEKCI